MCPMTTEAIPRGRINARKLNPKLAIAIVFVTGGLLEAWLGRGAGGGEDDALGIAGCEGAAAPVSGLAQNRQNFRPSIFSRPQFGQTMPYPSGKRRIVGH